MIDLVAGFLRAVADGLQRERAAVDVRPVTVHIETVHVAAGSSIDDAVRAVEAESRRGVRSFLRRGGDA